MILRKTDIFHHRIILRIRRYRSVYKAPIPRLLVMFLLSLFHDSESPMIYPNMRLAHTLCFVGLAWASVDRSDTLHTYENNVPRVHLDYATYEGTTQNSGVNEFLGMRFAGPDMLA